jgi:hypothetical protein
MVSPKRRQELSLGGMVSAIVVVSALVTRGLVRAHHRRR